MVENSPLAGAQYSLWRVNADGSLGVQITNSNQGADSAGYFVSAGNGVVTAGNLGSGRYVFLEENAPDGYIRYVEANQDEDYRNDLLYFEIAAGTSNAIDLNLDETLSQPVLNYRQSVEFQKTDAANNPLPGAVFTLQRQDNQGAWQDVETEITSDSAGQIAVTDLGPGAYQFVETTPPTGYLLNQTAIPFTIAATASTQPAVLDLASMLETGSFINYQQTVRIQKVDSTGAGLAGATFELLTEDNQVVPGYESFTTDEQGNLMFNRLASGNYQLIETKAPAGYILNDQPVAFTIPDHAESQPAEINLPNFYNYQQNVRLKKVNQAGTALAGAVFQLSDAEGKIVAGFDRLTSDDQGSLTLNNLAPGEYQLKEIAAPAGYLLNTQPIAISIAPEQTGAPETIELPDFINYQQTVRLEKTNAEGQPLAEAVFQLLDAEGQPIEGYQNLISDRAGIVEITGLAPGTYTLAETKAPAGYSLNTEKIPVTVAESAEGAPEEIELGTFVNYQQSVKFTKVGQSQVSGETQLVALAGAEFTLYQIDEGNQLTAITGTAHAANQAGRFVSDEAGQVSATALAPGEYVFIEEQAPDGYIRYQDQGTDYSNYRLYFEVAETAAGQPAVIDLDQMVTAENYLQNVQFTKVNEAGAGLAGAIFSLDKKDRDGHFEEIRSGITSTQTGAVLIEKLGSGDYQLRETQAPIGYLLNSQPIEFSIAETSTGPLAVLQLADFSNYRGSVTLTKVAADTQQPLADAVFDLQTSEGEVVASNLTTDQAGKINVNNLAPGNYRFVETRSPENYQVSSAVFDFTVPASAAGAPETINLRAENLRLPEIPQVPEEPQVSGGNNQPPGINQSRPQQNNSWLLQTNESTQYWLIWLGGLIFLGVVVFMWYRQRKQSH